MTRLTIVIDPILFLSPTGLPIIEGLSKVSNVWLPRELRNILVNNHFFMDHPDCISVPTELIRSSSKSPEDQDDEIAHIQQSTLTALKQWEVFQKNHDLGHTRLFWIGDNVQESLLPNDQNPIILSHTEWLAANIDSHIKAINPKLSQDSTIINAFRDVTALATSLENSLILSCQFPSPHNESVQPPLCDFYTQTGISTKEAIADDPVTLQHQRYLLQLLIQTGTAKWLWSSLRLFAIQLISPLRLPSSPFSNIYSLPLESSSDPLDWHRTLAVWHRI